MKKKSLELISEMIKGDRNAINAFYELYSPLIYGLCTIKCSEENVNEQFKKCFEVLIKNIKEAEVYQLSLKTWVITQTYSFLNSVPVFPSEKHDLISVKPVKRKV